MLLFFVLYIDYLQFRLARLIRLRADMDLSQSEHAFSTREGKVGPMSSSGTPIFGYPQFPQVQIPGNALPEVPSRHPRFSRQLR